MLEMVYIPSECRHVVEQLSDRTPRFLCNLPPEHILTHAQSLKVGLFDFDGTLVFGNQWQSLDALMPIELQQDQQKTREWYYSHTTSDDRPSIPMTDPDWFHGTLLKGNRLIAEGAWIAESIRIHAKAGITRKQIQKVGEWIVPRDGSLELLRLFDHRVIISFGIEQVIQAWADHHGVTSPVAASRLRFDERGVISGCHINLVASETKEFAADLFRERTGVREEDCLVVGDSLVDIAMMRPGGFNVLLIPPSEADKRLHDFRKNHLDVMWNRLTCILISDSLEPLIELIKTAREGILD